MSPWCKFCGKHQTAAFLLNHQHTCRMNPANQALSEPYPTGCPPPRGVRPQLLLHVAQRAPGRPMTHHCHALGCATACPPLMCGPCWARVPPDLQREVYRTVRLRAEVIDASWAPWWRAQARAIAHVAFLKEPDVARRDDYLARAMSTADRFERKGT